MPALAPAAPALSTPPGQSATDLALKEKLAQGPVDTKTQLDQIESDRQSTVSRLEAEREELKPPQLESVPAPTPKATDPMHVWGSAAITLALLGSLMTRQPLMTAMNAAAGVLNAYRQNDQRAANAAFQTWKISSENAMKLYDYQTKVYEKILGDIDRREHEADTQASHQETAAIAELRANAASFNDPLMADVKSYADYQRLALARQNFALRFEEAGEKLEEKHAANQALAELRSSPEYQSADARGRFKMEMDIMKYRAPNEYSQAVKVANDQFKGLIGNLKSARASAMDQLKSFKEAHNGVIPSDKPSQQQYAALQVKLQTADNAIENAYTSYQNQMGEIPLDQDNEDARPAEGTGSHNAPPFPPVREGQTAHGPGGTEWKVIGGRWVLETPEAK